MSRVWQKWGAAMWAIESKASSGANDLYRLAAVTGLLLAFFLFLGASGHLVAVWSTLSVNDSGMGNRVALLLPGLVLAASCIGNGLLAPGLWLRKRLARDAALLVNTLCALYLSYLLAKGVPGHPIGIFLCLVLHQLLILGAICVGLVWVGPVYQKMETDRVQSD